MRWLRHDWPRDFTLGSVPRCGKVLLYDHAAGVEHRGFGLPSHESKRVIACKVMSTCVSSSRLYESAGCTAVRRVSQLQRIGDQVTATDRPRREQLTIQKLSRTPKRCMH